MAVVNDLADCLGIEFDNVDLSILFALIFEGFGPLALKLVNPTELPDLLPDLGDVPKLIIAPIKAQLPPPLGDLEIPDPNIGIEIFSPDALIDLTINLGGAALGLPELFGLPSLTNDLGELDIDIPSLTTDLATAEPSPPSLGDLGAFLGLSLGLLPPAVDVDFPGKLGLCLAKSLGLPGVE